MRVNLGTAIVGDPQQVTAELLGVGRRSRGEQVALSGAQPSGIRSASDGDRGELTLVVDQKTRTPHD